MDPNQQQQQPPSVSCLNLSGLVFNAAKQAQMPTTNPPIEDMEGYKEGDRRDESTATRFFRVPWSYRHRFREWAMGYSTVDANGKLSRIVPAQHPEKPWLYCVECHLVEGRGAMVPSQIAVPQQNAQQTVQTAAPFVSYVDGDPNTYGGADGFAVMQCLYRDLAYEVADDTQLGQANQGEMGRFVERGYRFSIKALELPQGGRQLKFVNGDISPSSGLPCPYSTVVPGGMNLLMPLIGLEYLWREVPASLIPWGAIKACQGKTNQDKFDLVPGWGGPWQPQSLLMQSPEIHYLRNRVGLWCANLTYRFDFVPNTWNAFPAADGNFYNANYGNTSPPANSITAATFNLAFNEVQAVANAYLAAKPTPPTGAVITQAVVNGAYMAGSLVALQYGEPSLTDAQLRAMYSYCTAAAPGWTAGVDLNTAFKNAALAIAVWADQNIVQFTANVDNGPPVLLYPTADFNGLFKPPVAAPNQ